MLGLIWGHTAQPGPDPRSFWSIWFCFFLRDFPALQKAIAITCQLHALPGSVCFLTHTVLNCEPTRRNKSYKKQSLTLLHNVLNDSGIFYFFSFHSFFFSFILFFFKMKEVQGEVVHDSIPQFHGSATCCTCVQQRYIRSPCAPWKRQAT